MDELLELVREVWELEPDLRLGQLVFNAARMSYSQTQDVYSIEDAELRKGLLRYLELIKGRQLSAASDLGSGIEGG
jgi:hypothetical protein